MIRSLDQLEGSLVANIGREGHQGWVFAHPTMMDAYADRLRSPEFVHFLVVGFGTRALLAQTTCGDRGLHNAIVLPESLWPSVMDRLDEPLANGDDGWRQQRQRRSYLANQCVPAFQTAYLERHPGLLEDLAEPGLMLEVDPDNDLVASLHANGVLPEAIRAPFVERLIEYCIGGTDGAVLWARTLRGMLTPGRGANAARAPLGRGRPPPEIDPEPFRRRRPHRRRPGTVHGPDKRVRRRPRGRVPRHPDCQSRHRGTAGCTVGMDRRQPTGRAASCQRGPIPVPEPAERQSVGERSIFDDLVSDLT